MHIECVCGYTRALDNTGAMISLDSLVHPFQQLHTAMCALQQLVLGLLALPTLTAHYVRGVVGWCVHVVETTTHALLDIHVRSHTFPMHLSHTHIANIHHTPWFLSSSIIFFISICTACFGQYSGIPDEFRTNISTVAMSPFTNMTCAIQWPSRTLGCWGDAYSPVAGAPLVCVCSGVGQGGAHGNGGLHCRTVLAPLYTCTPACMHVHVNARRHIQSCRSMCTSTHIPHLSLSHIHPTHTHTHTPQALASNISRVSVGSTSTCTVSNSAELACFGNNAVQDVPLNAIVPVNNTQVSEEEGVV